MPVRSNAGILGSAKPTITDTAITAAARRAAASKAAQVLKDPGQAGLELRVAPSGGRMWRLQCRDTTGQPRRYTLGAYPALGLAQARTAARVVREMVRKGADPVADARKARRVAQDAREGIGTLKAALDLYGEQRGNAQRAWASARQRIDLLFKPLLSRPADTLTAIDFQLIADAWPKRWSAAYAVRSVRPALKWAAKRGYLAVSVADISPPVAVQRRERVLSREELAALLPVLRATPGPHAAAMLFMLLTLARRSEVADATWGEVDLADSVWTIPPARSKNAKAHAVPLSRQALALVRSRRAAAAGPEALVFASDAGTAPGNWDRQTKALQAASKTSGWTRHDLRRTGATMLGEMLIEPHVIEAALGHTHVHSQLHSVYSMARYLPQVAEALQRLGDALDLIADGGAKVVPLIRAC